MFFYVPPAPFSGGVPIASVGSLEGVGGGSSHMDEVIRNERGEIAESLVKAP